ncbi:MAG: aminoacetone oxidase family FAD-binding enzyme [Patescibacteria group bacterium]
MKKEALQKITRDVWDVVVVGGGPAGMMAAGRAAERGRSVLVLEKNDKLGKKLLITGGGRCNITNNTPDVRTMLGRYKESSKFLFSAFSQFSVKDSIVFFEKRNVALKEENDGRMFPKSNKAQTVWDVLVRYIKGGNVSVRTRASVSGIAQDVDSKHIVVTLTNSEKIVAKSCVVATGGTSHPETGSTGEGFKWLTKLGHTIIENNFALVPLALSDDWVKNLGGVTLPNIKLTVLADDKKQSVHRGRILFTHFGVSGPTVLNMSREIGELLEHSDVTILLDLFPRLDPAGMREKIQTLLMTESNKKIKNALSSLIPSALVGPILTLAGIDGDTPNHSVRSAERTKLTTLLKSIPLHVKGLLGANKAVISAGGVSLNEVDFKTMESRVVPRLYLVGDVLNIDRPSGGYSLQLCWTTGFVAGENA